MAELNKKKKKHDHKLTDWLKIIIFGLVMIAPFFAILVPCVYVSFNPNAKESYEYSTKIQVIEGNSGNVIEGNTIYLKYIEEEGSYNYGMQYYYNWISIDFNNYTNVPLTFVPDGFRVRSNQSIDLHNPETNSWLGYASIWGNKLFNITFILKTTPPNFFNGGNSKASVIYQTQETLSNAFTYAVNQMVESPVFNWTQQTGMYNIINSMTSDLEMSSGGNIIATLLTYWSLNVAIYIIFDIILWAFTKITHFLNE